MNPEYYQKLIAKFSRFCSVCGKKLDMPYPDWHFPFCQKCRRQIFNIILNEDVEKILEHEKNN
jgi:endogenous inhibitor of DNA gyrase (YacG/DUF329 family)